MKIPFQKLLVLFLILFTFSFLNLSKTKDVSANTVDDSSSYSTTTASANCSDYYRLNNVQIVLNPKTTHTVSGTTMSFSGYVVNSNKYPIVDGKIYGRILRNGVKNEVGKYDVLDTFVIKDGLNLKTGDKIPVNFNWKIPAYSASGEYKLVTYFIESNKFNLAGLSFSNSLVGGISGFFVKGLQDAGVYFNRDGIKINNIPYVVDTNTPSVSSTTTVNIFIPVSNATKVRQAVRAEFNVYKFDAQSADNKLDTINQVLIIEPGKTINVPVQIKDTQHSVYYVESVLKYKDAKSVIDIRFARNDISAPNIDFPSIISYPLVSGQKNKIFACFHNFSNNTDPIDGKLKLEILDNKDNQILSYEYTGKIGAAMSAVAQEFIPHSTYRDFKIHASIFDGSKLVEEVYIPYSCNLIDPTKCGAFDFGMITSNKWLMIVLTILAIIILISIIVLIILKFDKIKMFFIKLFKSRATKVLSIIIFSGILAFSVSSIAYAGNLSSGSGSGSGSGPGPGPDDGNSCFKVTNINPPTSDTCATPDCGPNNKASAVATGVRLGQITSVSLAGNPVTLSDRTDTSMTMTFTRLHTEHILDLTFIKAVPLPICKQKGNYAFVCKKPIYF